MIHRKGYKGVSQCVQYITTCMFDLTVRLTESQLTAMILRKLMFGIFKKSWCHFDFIDLTDNPNIFIRRCRSLLRVWLYNLKSCKMIINFALVNNIFHFVLEVSHSIQRGRNKYDTQAYKIHQYFENWIELTDSTDWTRNRPLHQLVWFQLYPSIVEPT